MAEAEGIEPPRAFTPITVFKTDKHAYLAYFRMYLVYVARFELAVPYLASRYVGLYTTHASFLLLSRCGCHSAVVVTTIAAVSMFVNPQFSEKIIGCVMCVWRKVWDSNP